MDCHTTAASAKVEGNSVINYKKMKPTNKYRKQIIYNEIKLIVIFY